MAVGVVDPLEPIDVDHQQRSGCACASRGDFLPRVRPGIAVRSVSGSVSDSASARSFATELDVCVHHSTRRVDQRRKVRNSGASNYNRVPPKRLTCTAIVAVNAPMK
jgi:hypothetical protein